MTKKKEAKLFCRVNPHGGGGVTIVLDEPITEEDFYYHYPTAWFMDGNKLLKISFETDTSLDEAVPYKGTGMDRHIAYDAAGGKEKLIALLRSFRDKAIKSNIFSTKYFMDF